MTRRITTGLVVGFLGRVMVRDILGVLCFSGSTEWGRGGRQTFFARLSRMGIFSYSRMEKTETYYFHQTPAELCRDLIPKLPLLPTDRLYEPFRGEGGFYNAFPAENPKDWSEIVEGRDYNDYTEEYDWVITNPPFRLDTGSKRVNAFWYLIDYYTQRAKKGVAFLANDSCFGTLTPGRMKLLNERGWYIQKVVVCSIKKWRGRYYFFILMKNPSQTMDYLLASY